MRLEVFFHWKYNEIYEFALPFQFIPKIKHLLIWRPWSSIPNKHVFPSKRFDTNCGIFTLWIRRSQNIVDLMTKFVKKNKPTSTNGVVQMENICIVA